MLDTQKFFEALTKMNLSQNRIAQSFNTTASTVYGWIKQKRQPQLTARDIYNGVDLCRDCYSHYKKNDEFINDLIKNLDITDKERRYFSTKYDSFKSQKFPDDICYEKFMLDLIQMSLDKADCPTETLSYDPANASRPIVGIGGEHIVAVRDDGRVYSTGANDYQQCATHAWRDIVSISAGWRSTVGLKNDGTCIAVGHDVVGNGEIYKWNDIVAVACGTRHILGLRSDGSVEAWGSGGYGQCNLGSWDHITAIAAGHGHSVGLKDDGTVVAAGNNEYGQCNVGSWKNVVAVAASGDHTIGLTSDSKILAVGDTDAFCFDSWHDIISIATGNYHVIGLKKDGTVVATGHQANGQCDVFHWHDIIAVYAGFFKTAGICADGRILSTVCKYGRSSGYTDTSSWQLFPPSEDAVRRKSKYELLLLHVLDSLKSAKRLAIQYTPYINEYRSPSDIHIISHTPEIDKTLYRLFQLSRELYTSYNNSIPVPPVTDLITAYSAAFCDFYNTLAISNDETVPGSIPSYEPTGSSYDTFVDFLVILNQSIRHLESLVSPPVG